MSRFNCFYRMITDLTIVEELELVELFRCYCESALWSSLDNNGQPLNELFSPSDMEECCLNRMLNDCRKFLEDQRVTIMAAYDQGWFETTDKAFQQAGHDFWLTRNGHGCGFWDGGWPDRVGEILARAAKKFGEFSLYVTYATDHGYRRECRGASGGGDMNTVNCV